MTGPSGRISPSAQRAIDAALVSPVISDWLKFALRTALGRRPENAAEDAVLLASLLQGRAGRLGRRVTVFLPSVDTEPTSLESILDLSSEAAGDLTARLLDTVEGCSRQGEMTVADILVGVADCMAILIAAYAGSDPHASDLVLRRMAAMIEESLAVETPH